FGLAHPQPLYEPVHQAYTEKYGPPPEEDPASHPAAVTDTAASSPRPVPPAPRHRSLAALVWGPRFVATIHAHLPGLRLAARLVMAAALPPAPA
ncbi:MAG TPA: hypothetical protein VF468_31210, partial [Actinomycetota bacterium]|nr:hypothetical protein [Actinomycetota bacterium]